MQFLSIWTLYVSLCLAFADKDGFTFPLLMPHVQPLEKETYLCTAFKMPKYQHQYIIEFRPNATANTAHHILIYGCETPGYYERDTPRGVWNCGEMMHKQNTDYPKAGTCGTGSQIIYAWAKDAPKLVLPEGVGFKVGGSTRVNFIVLQVHYAHVKKFQDGATDDSGIFLTMVPGNSERVNKRAGVLLMGTSGRIPAGATEHMETTCTIKDDLQLHPFAFRTHTHKLGTAVSGWRVNETGWELIGRHDPQKAQMFYPVQESNSILIKRNDIIAARCTMVNNLTHDVSIGATGDDEMCNFYMMYYVDGDQLLSRQYCFTAGPPYYRWSYDNKLPGIPQMVDVEASKL